MSLAIVIPAFKPNFLRETLRSLSLQSDKRFVLYIGDDASPHNLKSIVEEFEPSFEIVYKRFETNLGSISLVKHWDRCIEMCIEEDWIWLFSDDDMMDSNCVENFHSTLSATNHFYDLYKFNVRIIKEDNSIKEMAPIQSGIISSLEFLKMKVSGKIYTYAIDYIFRKSTYKAIGFIEFPLAWCSDDATWAMLAKKTGMFVIPHSLVSWRISSYNISGDTSKHYKLKQDALLAFLAFIKQQFGLARNIDQQFFHDQKNYFLGNIDDYRAKMTLLAMISLARKLSLIWEDSFFHNLKLLIMRHPSMNIFRK